MCTIRSAMRENRSFGVYSCTYTVPVHCIFRTQRTRISARSRTQINNVYNPFRMYVWVREFLGLSMLVKVYVCVGGDGVLGGGYLRKRESGHA